MKIGALALLLAQLSGGPFARLPGDPTVAIGVAPQGMLVAWSDMLPGRAYAVIHVGILDFDGNWISPIRTLAPRHHDLHAATPAIATDGERFFVAWVDRKGSSFLPLRVSGTLVSAEGEQISETFDLSDAVSGSPSIVWNGLAFQSYGWTSYTITPHGAVQATTSPAVAGRVPFATPDANGWADWRETPGRVFCSGFTTLICGRTPAVYGLDWAIVSHSGIHTGGIEEIGFNAGRPAVIAHEDDLLVIWSDAISLKALPIIDGRPGRVVRSEKSGAVVEPSAAESLVVFESGGNIYGVPIVDGPSFGDPFPITATKQPETQPRVYLVGLNRYLVTWVVDGDRINTRLVGRFVTIE